MTSEASIVLASGLGGMLFAAVFFFGGKIHLLAPLIRDARSLASLGAGLSTAYVFVHLMPELAEAREAYFSSAAGELRYEGMGIYLVALAAFVVFYGLEHFRRSRNRESSESGEGGFTLQMTGWAAYVAVASYLLARGLGETTVATTAVYAVAIAFHFLAADHGFRREHAAAYASKGRLVLAAAAIGGWLLSLLLALPVGLVAGCVAFVSGAVIVNSAIMELPTEKDGRFVPFAVGSVLYSLILLPLG